ncbi:BTB/POZ domain-containing protein At3g56230 [Linum perenne]
MDCSICTTMPLILRPPRNTICAGCYEAARTTISLVNNFESGEKGPSSTIDHHPAQSHKPNPQPLANLPRWIKSMKDKEDELTDKIDFLSNFVDMFRSQLLTDIYLRPGTDAAPSIPAHRALLISEAVCSSNELKEAALRYVVKNMDELAFSGKYDVFVARNPHLAVQVTRAFLVDTKQLLLLHNKQ